MARESWNSQAGFLLAAVGSAVGLGNMWRFSYLAAEHGGAAFMVLYLGFTVLVGLPILLAEFTIGRGSGQSPIRALEHFGGRGWRWLGWLFVASGFLILAYYSVIAGWTLRYALGGLTGFVADSGSFFSEVATGTDAVLWHLGFMGIAASVVAGGIRGGIERAAVVLMPVLFVLLVGLAIYAATLEGSDLGYRHYLNTDFSAVFDREVMVQAAGQAFFSLSLGMGAMLTFASYLDRGHGLQSESVIVAGSDFAVAFVAGLVVFPLIFAFGLESDVSGSTVGALFITLPRAFSEMGAAGNIVGVLFFAGLAVGALTSAVSLLEVIVSSAIDGLGWSRRRATAVFAAATAVLGLPAALDLDWLGLMDQVAGNLFLVFGGLMLAIFVGWRMEDPISVVAEEEKSSAWLPVWRWLVRFVVPIVLILVLAGSVETTWALIAAEG